MSITLRTPTKASVQGPSTNILVPVPGNLQPKDQIVMVSFGVSGALGAVSGFSDSGQQNSSAFYVRAYVRTADGTEGSNFTVPNAGTPGLILCAAYGGVAEIDPSTIPAAYISSVNNANIPLAAMTLANSGDWVAWFGASMRNASTSPGTVTAPANFNKQLNATISNATTTESIYAIFADLEAAQPSGSFSSAALTGSSSLSVPHAGFAIGLTPKSIKNPTVIPVCYA